MEQPATDAVPPPDQGVGDEDFAFYVGQATALVAEFKETQQKVLQSQFHRDKVAARRNLSDIRQRKMQLLEKAASPRFSAAEAETIKGILAEITEVE